MEHEPIGVLGRLGEGALSGSGPATVRETMARRSMSSLTRRKFALDRYPSISFCYNMIGSGCTPYVTACSSTQAPGGRRCVAARVRGLELGEPSANVA
ncbi:hypothetical protein RHCRD62_20024 [Rhodococcus sp. RD6.2]|nr:hypothetical protein RHCRD62_20024 [Rhodococcus sp. RD6.2]